eukprot:2319904-Prymnesium_polylepis.1
MRPRCSAGSSWRMRRRQRSVRARHRRLCRCASSSRTACPNGRAVLCGTVRTRTIATLCSGRRGTHPSRAGSRSTGRRCGASPPCSNGMTWTSSARSARAVWRRGLTASSSPASSSTTTACCRRCGGPTRVSSSTSTRGGWQRRSGTSPSC